jgi:RecJ-like exonuclease
VIGMGDILASRIDTDERAAAKWSREASHNELVGEGICPYCRGEGCAGCDGSGRVELCDGCGAMAAEGALARVPASIDRPNGPQSKFCATCKAAYADERLSDSYQIQTR